MTRRRACVLAPEAVTIQDVLGMERPVHVIKGMRRINDIVLARSSLETLFASLQNGQLQNLGLSEEGFGLGMAMQLKCDLSGD